jgi:hypothetical protein
MNPVVTPFARRPDWFVVPAEWLPELAGVPGVTLLGSAGGVHRSHLPLLAQAHPEVHPFLNVPLENQAARSRLDASTEPLGFKLRPYQHEGREFIHARRGTLLADQMRLGKGQPLDACVLTPTGWKTMGDLIVGSRVVDPDGGEGVVEDIFPRGRQRVYRVTTCDGRSTECDEDHLWLLHTAHSRWRGGDPRPRALKTFKDNLWIKTPSRSWGRGNRRFFLPLCRPPEGEDTDLFVEPYLLGCLLGNGMLRSGTPEISTSEREILDRIRPSLSAYGVVPKAAGGVDWRLSSPAGQENKLTTALRALKLWGCGAQDKFIPVQYLSASVPVRRALLHGLMDTDGDVTEERITSYNTVSTRLKDDVRALIESLGGFASVYYKAAPQYSYRGEKREGRPSYRLHIRLPANPFLLARKTQRWSKGRLARGLESVEYVGEKETRCIQVSTKRGLYVTDGFIVTHNTATSVMSHDPGLGPLVIVAPLATRAVWVGWMKRRWPDVEPVVLRGRKYDPTKISDAPCIFIHYDILQAHQNMGLRRPGTLVFDEAHILQNRRSKRSQAAILLASRAERVIAATGTPLWNRPIGLWTILSVVNPGAWNSYYDFAQRYCAPKLTAYGTRYDGSSNEAEFKLRIAEVMIRREWRDVLEDLPPSERTVEVADLTESQLFKLEVAAEKIRDPSKRRVAAGDMVRFRRLIGQYKAKLAVDVASRVLAGEEPVVVWAWHRDVADKIATNIAKRDYIAYCITGADDQDARDRTIDEWKRHPVAALVLTIPVGQVGIDLSHARQAIFAEVDWTPSTVAQAEMRTFSPYRPMAITYLVVDHDVDRGLIETLQHKCELATTIGVPASDTAIDVIASAFGLNPDDADMDRLMKAFLAGYDGESN